MPNRRRPAEVPGQLALTFTATGPAAPIPAALSTRDYLHHMATGNTHIRRPTIWTAPHLYDHRGHPIAPISLARIADMEANGLITAHHQADGGFPVTVTDLGRQLLDTAPATAA